jgi:hypothetical protein
MSFLPTALRRITSKGTTADGKPRTDVQVFEK